MRALAILTVPLLYVFFSLVGVMAGVLGVLSLPWGTKRISNICRALDALAAAVWGWDGRSTVSTELGRRNPDCLLCRVLHYALEKEHCRKTAGTTS